MKKQYVYEYCGTLKEFENHLKQKYGSDEICRCKDYIVEKVSGSEYHFGISRGGHSSGYWFIAAVSEHNDKTYFIGKIVFKNDNTPTSTIGKIADKLLNFLFIVILLPVAIPCWIYSFIEKTVNRIRKKPLPPTNEDILNDLMTNFLDCRRVLSQ